MFKTASYFRAVNVVRYHELLKNGNSIQIGTAKLSIGELGEWFTPDVNFLRRLKGVRVKRFIPSIDCCIPTKDNIPLIVDNNFSKHNYLLVGSLG